MSAIFRWHFRRKLGSSNSLGSAHSCGQQIIKLLIVALSISSCTITTTIRDLNIPIPAIEPIPAKIAVLYSEEFRTYKHVGPALRDSAGNDVSQGMKLGYQLGDINVSLFDQLTTNMFRRTETFDSWEALAPSREQFDAVLEPTIEHFDTWQGEDGGFKLPGVFLNVTYRLKMYVPDNQEILNWSLESHQVFCIELVVSCGPSTKRDIVEAGLRDVAAQFYLKFPSLPEISSWTATL